MGILDGKIAIITGAGQGLGEGAAHAMTQEGACVALWGRTFEKVERVANDINKAGGRALAIKCDVSIRAEVDEALKKTKGYWHQKSTRFGVVLIHKRIRYSDGKRVHGKCYSK